MTEPRFDVVGIGNAIVDVLAETSDTFLEERSMAKGTMSLVGEQHARALCDDMKPGLECSGGSAANTLVGLASLGGRAAFVGKVHDDRLGTVFREDIQKVGVQFDTPPSVAGPSTARCLVFVTPDGERTMQTYLGASALLDPEDVDPAMVADAEVTYLEGYLWDPPEAKQAFLKAAETAHQAGRKVSLTLSDPFCVDRHRDEFRDLAENHVDILFGNEDEIVSLYRAADFDAAVAAVRGKCDLVVLTRGKRGAVVLAGESTHVVEAAKVDRVVDTTGAGDLFASGFLFGITHGQDPAAAGRIGAAAAAEIIGHYGARPERRLSELVATLP